MPPRSKQPTEAVVNPDKPETLLPQVGSFVHVVTLSGATFKSSEILETYGSGIVIRTDLNGPTRAEVSFIPWTSIVGVGLIGKR